MAPFFEALLGYTVHKLDHWLRGFTFEDFLSTARERPLGLRSNLSFHPLLHEIRALVPVEGTGWVKDIDVTIGPRVSNHQGQRKHRHDEWTAVFYVNPTSPIAIIEDGEEKFIQPEPGDVVVMEPRVEHRATANKSNEVRLSFAMLVEDPNIPSKFSS